MIKEQILIQCLVLLYRETLLDDDSNKSNAVITSIINLDNDNKSRVRLTLGKELEFYNNIKDLILDLMNNPSLYTKNALLEKIQIICQDKPSIYNVILNQLNTTLDKKELVKEIIASRNYLSNYHKEAKIRLLVDRANKDLLKNNFLENGMQEYITNFVAQIQSLTIATELKDPAILDETNMASDQDLDIIVKKVKDQNNSDKILKTGWKELNDMTQGGFRRREMWMITAMQHNYKSGCLQSLFVQFCIHNKPVLKDPNKKPAIVYISFEDDSSVYTEFIYKYLYYNINKEIPDLSETRPEQIQDYIKSNLSVNGYTPLTLRVNPTAWTYLHLFNKIMSYESQGYEIHACIIDYLSKLPTTGCLGGPNGADLRDLYQRCRAFFTNKEIALVTAHQLSTEAKKLIKNGLDRLHFAEEVAGKGYTEGSGQLDQIVDGEIAIALAKKDKKHVLTFYRGKHRIPTILSDEKKGFFLTFERNAPLKETLHDVEGHDDELGDFSF